MANHAAHAHPAYLAHHFEDVEQQHEAVTIGMWAFLVTEVMFFGGFFLAYMAYRLVHPAGFAEASNLLNLELASLNTVILLCSSFTMALAVYAAQTRRKGLLFAMIVTTMILATVFLGFKGVEYYHEFEEGLIPGALFHPEEPLEHPREVELFFTIYFVMTSLHATHMIIGIAIMAVLAWYSLRDRYTQGHYAPIELFGLYWHFVDIVWVFLFPLVYLVGRHAT